MNTYSVYHRKTLIDINSFENAISRLNWPEEYHLVASVEAENLDQAYAKTQHIDQQWWQNTGVELLAESRSTSIGDILIGPDCHIMVVMPVGFADLSAEMGHRILADAEEAFGIRSLILERSATGNWPRPVSIPEYLFWLETETRLQAGQLYNDILFYRQNEPYVRALFGIVMELRAWGFTPALPPWVTFTLVNTESIGVDQDGEFPLLPAESPHTYDSLVDASQALADLIRQHGHSLNTIKIFTLEPVSQTKILAAIQAEATQSRVLP